MKNNKKITRREFLIINFRYVLMGVLVALLGLRIIKKEKDICPDTKDLPVSRRCRKCNVRNSCTIAL